LSVIGRNYTVIRIIKIIMIVINYINYRKCIHNNLLVIKDICRKCGSEKETIQHVMHARLRYFSINAIQNQVWQCSGTHAGILAESNLIRFFSPILYARKCHKRWQAQHFLGLNTNDHKKIQHSWSDILFDSSKRITYQYLTDIAVPHI
jgi:HJR/Mrr/RecB family endonuclease